MTADMLASSSGDTSGHGDAEGRPDPADVELAGRLIGPQARLLNSSVTEAEERLVTWELVIHRFVLAELNTHRTTAKNSASSRAIPARVQLAQLHASPAYPLTWSSEQRGMQGGAPLDGDQAFLARVQWYRIMQAAVAAARELRVLGLHKSLSNRILEPFMFHRVALTGSAMENFFRQRDHVDAQPEIAAVAALMHRQWLDTEPDVLPLGAWHLPYVGPSDRDQVMARLARGSATDRVARLAAEVGVERTLARISSARCARTSYLTNPVMSADGDILEPAKVDLERDLDLYERLVAAEPRHWSPLEHPATPWPENRQSGDLAFEIAGKIHRAPLGHLPRIGCFVGYRTLRTEVETVLGDITYR